MFPHRFYHIHKKHKITVCKITQFVGMHVSNGLLLVLVQSLPNST